MASHPPVFNYRGAEWLEPLCGGRYTPLSDLNRRFITAICGYLGIATATTSSGAPNRSSKLRADQHVLPPTAEATCNTIKTGEIFGPIDPNQGMKEWHGQQGSNLRPAVLETAALPTELCPCMRFLERRRFLKASGGSVKSAWCGFWILCQKSG